MWWKTFGIATAFLAAPAMAQTLDETLAEISVFDCTAAGERAVFVFRSDPRGNVSLLTNLAAAARSEDGGFVIESEAGRTEISPRGYFIFRDGEEISGRCVSETGVARAVYPAVTDSLLPGTAGEDLDANDMAALVTIDDLRARLSAAEARIVEAEAEIVAAESEIEATHSELVALEEKLETARTSNATLLTNLQAKQGEIASLTGDLDAASGERDDALAEVDSVGLANEKLQAVVVRLEQSADEQDALFATLSEEFHGLAAAHTELEQTQRDTVAHLTVANQMVSDLGGELDETKVKLVDTEEALTAMRRLADTAVARIATAQIRDADTVRREVCNLVPRDLQPEVCQN